MLVLQHKGPPEIQVLDEAHRYVEAFFVSALQEPTDKPICLQLSLVNEPHVVQNTEQMSRNHCLRQAIQNLHNVQCKNWWDQSLTNIQILQSHIQDPEILCKIQYKPLHMSAQQTSDYQKVWRSAFKIQDLAFVGTLTPRRSKIIEEIRRAGLSVNVIQSFGFEDTLKECLSARAILNVHAGPDQEIFETARCIFFLEADLPVISETSLDNDARATLFDVSQPNWTESITKKCLELRALLWRQPQITEP